MRNKALILVLANSKSNLSLEMNVQERSCDAYCQEIGTPVFDTLFFELSMNPRKRQRTWDYIFSYCDKKRADIGVVVVYDLLSVCISTDEFMEVENAFFRIGISMNILSNIYEISNPAEGH